MLRHYIKIAWRNLGRQKVLSFINVIGLAVGLSCFALFLLYAVNEFSFDRFHKNGKDIYRVYRWSENFGGEQAHGDVYMPSPLGPALKKDFPDVVSTVRMNEGWGESFIRIDDHVTRGTLAYADPTFFDLFSFDFIYGNSKSALNGLSNVVVTKKKAMDLFGSENVVGRSIQVKVADDFETFTVSGVLESIPANSSVTFEMLGNFAFWESSKYGKNRVGNWRQSSYLTFVQLRPGSGLPNDLTRLTSFRHKYYPEEEEELKKSGIVWKGEGFPIKFKLQPIQDIHTSAVVSGGSVETVKPKTIWILLAIAGGVLLIACINFTTLAIGRSARRAKEVGVRKVIGGERSQLVTQFLSEAVLLTILSACIGFLLVVLLLPSFNQLSGRELRLSFAQYPELAWMLGGLILLVGLLAGAYPALVLSGFRPLEVLKSKVRVNGSNLFTKSLVTVQFALSIGLIISTMIILKQTRFMNDKNPGFNKENVIVVNASETDSRRIYPLFNQALSNRTDILGMAGSEVGIGADEGWSVSGFEYGGKHRRVFEYFVDADYIPVMGMQLLTGRNFDPRIASDTTVSVIVNEAMVQEFGWTVQNAVGQHLLGYNEEKTPVVIGVVKNFNFRSLSEKVEPQLFQQFADYTAYKYFVRVAPGNPSGAIAAMEKAWKSVESELPFKYSFLDDSMNNFYRAEQRWGRIIGWAGGISIFLACLGLFGLASLAAVNRTREIGIRRVLGASLGGIVSLLSRDFIRLVLISLFIAGPLAWYFMDKWLQDFAYRTSIGGWVFLIAGGMALLVALLTTGVQAIRAGIASPAKSLRSE